MSKSKERPVRIECMGGCGKHQMVRPSKIERSIQFFGCMNCEGCEQAKKYALATRADGVHMEYFVNGHGGIAGFGGWRMRISTPEDKAAFERARAIRDAALCKS